MIALLGLVSACGSGDDQEQNDRTAMTHQEADKTEVLPSSDAWVREPPIDVPALDANGDGYVYQDPMDWNVIADEEGKCPQCGMLLKRVSLVQATENLRKFGFEVVERPEN